MKLKNPGEVKELLAERGWLTLGEQAKGVDVATNTLAGAFAGEPIRAGTVRKLADAIGRKPTEIAEFV
jgi:hypothetical protein